MASLGAQVKGEFQRSLEPFFAPGGTGRDCGRSLLLKLYDSRKPAFYFSSWTHSFM